MRKNGSGRLKIECTHLQSRVQDFLPCEYRKILLHKSKPYGNSFVTSSLLSLTFVQYLYEQSEAPFFKEAVFDMFISKTYPKVLHSRFFTFQFRFFSGCISSSIKVLLCISFGSFLCTFLSRLCCLKLGLPITCFR